MKDTKSIVAKNISELRQAHNLTQLELAEQLNYSDKTISKWERGESSPDIGVLVEIAELFGVTLDDLVKERCDRLEIPKDKPRTTGYNRRVIAYISESVAWIVAIFAFIITTLILQEMSFQFLYFVYALPIVLIVKLVFNSIWFNQRRNYGIISLLMWTGVACVILTVACFDFWPWKLLLLGIPGQIAILVWSRFQRKAEHK